MKRAAGRSAGVRTAAPFRRAPQQPSSSRREPRQRPPGSCRYPRPRAQLVERLAEVCRDRSAAVPQVHERGSGVLRPYGSERSRSFTAAAGAVVVGLPARAAAGEQADHVVGVDQRHGAAAPRLPQVLSRARDAGRVGFEVGQVPRPALFAGGDHPAVRARRRVRPVGAAFGRRGGLAPRGVPDEAVDLGPRPLVLVARLGKQQRHAGNHGETPLQRRPVVTAGCAPPGGQAALRRRDLIRSACALRIDLPVRPTRSAVVETLKFV